jgi:hypothetical protein
VEFNDLLLGAGYDLRDVAVMLHQPSVAGQRGALLSLVDDHPELFELYQDTHPRGPEATLKSRKYAASFVVNDYGEARFVAIYRVQGWVYQSFAELSSDQRRTALADKITGENISVFDGSDSGGRAVFNLEPLSDFSALKGRLIVPRPAGRAYVRLAENCALPITRIEEEARFIPPMPTWDALTLGAQDIRTIPRSWADRLSQWRGIYHIVDTFDGARYVGSAYGEENILGRWRAHVQRERGVTVELGKRDPISFRFSILELLAPNAAMEDVVAREGSWKERLATREPHIGGLNKN